MLYYTYIYVVVCMLYFMLHYVVFSMLYFMIHCIQNNTYIFFRWKIVSISYQLGNCVNFSSTESTNY